jgi:hypothetical protein
MGFSPVYGEAEAYSRFNGFPAGSANLLWFDLASSPKRAKSAVQVASGNLWCHPPINHQLSTINLPLSKARKDAAKGHSKALNVQF